MDNSVVEKANVLTSYILSSIGFAAGLTFNEWVALISLFLGLGTFSVNWYYKHKTLKLRQHNNLKSGDHYDKAK
ncbi:phage holin family protein [Gammaproteobacteria bacterium]|nr:phage holin family protein [Gammaproteobacteria bacterium]